MSSFIPTSWVKERVIPESKLAGPLSPNSSTLTPQFAMIVAETRYMDDVLTSISGQVGRGVPESRSAGLVLSVPSFNLCRTWSALD